MGLKGKIRLLCLVAFIVPLVTLGIFGVINTDNVYREMSDGQINSLGEVKTAHLKSFFEGVVETTGRFLEQEKWLSLLGQIVHSLKKGDDKFRLSDLDLERIGQLKRTRMIKKISYIDTNFKIYHSFDGRHMVLSSLEDAYPDIKNWRETLNKQINFEGGKRLLFVSEQINSRYVDRVFIVLPLISISTDLDGVLLIEMEAQDFTKKVNSELHLLNAAWSSHLLVKLDKRLVFINRNFSVSDELNDKIIDQTLESDRNHSIEYRGDNYTVRKKDFGLYGSELVLIILGETGVLQRHKEIYNNIFILFIGTLGALGFVGIWYYSRKIAQPYFKELDDLFRELREQRQNALKNAYLAGSSQKASFTIHNIKNLLTVVGLGLDKIVMTLASKKKSPDEKTTIVSETVKSLEERLESSLKIIELQQGEVKNLSRSVNVDIQKMISNILNDVRLSQKTIQISSIVEVEEIFTDQNKLFQVLNNLISNAVDAVMANKDEKKIEVNVYDLGDQIKIDILDNGTGIKESVLEKIGSFGFSTKESGHGFGLAFCKSTVEEVMDGLFDVHSEGEGKGARFTLVIPKGLQAA